MGIPKYFRFITNKYPDLIIDKLNTINNINNDNNIDNIIDNLFLDTNCLIHPCCKKIIDENPELIKIHNDQYKNNENNINNDLNSLSLLETKMFDECIQYIYKLTDFCKPNKLLYISIDGVAPRAKMEQQRIRRYRTQFEKNMRQNIYKKYNKDIDFWDTNAITPGTTFMIKLSNYISNNINKYITDNIDIILSDSSIPGEGEHKIIEYIRNIDHKSISSIYGLDADLIMLSLCLDNEIYLLREDIKFGQVSNNKLLYLSIPLFKTRLKEEIISNIDIQEITEFELDSRVVIDYVFLCFLLGNDFLPNLITLDISEGSINDLLLIYTKLISIRKKYIITNNIIDYTFLQQILNQLYNFEDGILDKFQKNIDNKIINTKYYKSVLDKELDMLKFYPIYYKKDNSLKFGSKNWRNQYYKHYFHIDNITKSYDFIENLCKIYLEGLQWNIKYYLEGCCSWKWYYPYPAAPSLRELCQYLNNRIYIKDFGISKPYLPIQQLFLVIPKDSSHLLPEEYQKLINSNLDGIVEYFPDKFILDTANKIWLHQCNPILPIINDSKIIQYLNKYKFVGLNFKKNTNNTKPSYIKKKTYEKNIFMTIS